MSKQSRLLLGTICVLAVSSHLIAAQPTNVALGKKVTLGKGFGLQGNGATLVDGSVTDAAPPTWNLNAATCSYSVFAEIDLGAQYKISEVRVWQLVSSITADVAYCGQRLELSKTGLFIGEQATTWNGGSSYGTVETSTGRVVASEPGEFRYVRFYTSKSNVDAYARISEISVLGTLATPSNLALGKPVTLSYGASNAAAMVDGDTTPSKWSSAPNWDVNTCSQTAYATIDLGTPVSISEVRVWQYYGDTRFYCNQKLELSLSGSFAGEQVTTWNTGPSYSTIAESSTGNVVATNPEGVFRYVRYYSSRNNLNTGVHIAEISVLGFVAPLPNLAFGKSVTLSATPSSRATVAGNAVDGNTDPSTWTAAPTWDVATCSESRYLTIDLGFPADLQAVRVWQYHGDLRKYCGQKLELSLTGAFAGEQVTTWNTGPSTALYEFQQGTLMTPNPVNAVRYVRFHSSKSDQNTGIHVIEVAAYGVPSALPNVALGKTVTLSSVNGPASGVAANLVDGNTSPANWVTQPNWNVDTCNKQEYATIDLGQLIDIQQIKVWQYYGEYPKSARFYCNQKLELSTTGSFAGEQVAKWNTGPSYSTIAETPEGNIVANNPGAFRYVRYYSSRNNLNVGVHIAEVAVYGFPPVAVTTASVGDVSYSMASSSVVIASVAAMCIALVVVVVAKVVTTRRRQASVEGMMQLRDEPQP